jgi:PHS family inorganic phosphate transporter-like MFS transporter
VRGATAKNANPWLNHVLEIYALFMFLGIFTTLCIPETKRVTLEVLSGEDDAIVDDRDELTHKNQHYKEPNVEETGSL